MRLRTQFCAAAALLAGVAQYGHPSSAFAAPAGDAVVLWNTNAGVVATKACMEAADNNDPFHESRMYAMMHIAIHDALNAIDRKYQSYAFDKQADAGTSPDAAVAAAARDVLTRSSPNCRLNCTRRRASMPALPASKLPIRAALAAIPDAPAKTQGIALGQASAAAILAKRADDHSTAGPLLNKNCPRGPAWEVSVHTGIPLRRL